jgi:phosphatidylethanolamine/phosphatidyl-N-methylethanolamine N-methyltransferase
MAMPAPQGRGRLAARGSRATASRSPLTKKDCRVPMNSATPSSGRLPRPPTGLDADAVRAAYRRWASIYDTAFGGISAWGRRAAVQAINTLPGRRVLEAGVGTGLALPLYAPDKRVVGIDLSSDMLSLARERVVRDRLGTVEAVLEMDAEATSFTDGDFDIAVAMFVASVVPHPRRLLTELRRVVRPGGHILLVNHFAAERGPRWWVERALAPASRALGWHPDFRLDALLAPDELAVATVRPMHPFGLFTLVQLRN